MDEWRQEARKRWIFHGFSFGGKCTGNTLSVVGHLPLQLELGRERAQAREREGEVETERERERETERETERERNHKMPRMSLMLTCT